MSNVCRTSQAGFATTECLSFQLNVQSLTYIHCYSSWEKKRPLSKSAIESTWLFHEIGRCHLELQHYQEAKDYGEKSMEAANEADDDVWQLNASVLVAQAEGTFYCVLVSQA